MTEEEALALLQQLRAEFGAAWIVGVISPSAELLEAFTAKLLTSGMLDEGCDEGEARYLAEQLALIVRRAPIQAHTPPS